eukprot:maker-scaffold_8-snap-gene-10.52-mRNA-1 protein AED:0.00 eAED:0.00 QI:83/1/1/1/1/1/2/242/82
MIGQIENLNQRNHVCKMNDTKEREERDCLGCRTVALTTCSGVSGWFLHQRSLVAKSARGHRAVLLAASVGVGSVGLYRFFDK